MKFGGKKIILLFAFIPIFLIVPTNPAYAGAPLGTFTLVYEFGLPPKVYTADQFFPVSLEVMECGPVHHHAVTGIVTATDGTTLIDTELCGFGDLTPYLQSYDLISTPLVITTPRTIPMGTWSETVFPVGDLTVESGGSLNVDGDFVCNGTCNFESGSLLDISSTGKFMASDLADIQFDGDLDTSGEIFSTDQSNWDFESPSGNPFWNFKMGSTTQFAEVTFDVDFFDIEPEGELDMEINGLFRTTDLTIIGNDFDLNSGVSSEIILDSDTFGTIFTDGFESGDTSAWSNSGTDSVTNSALNTFTLTALFNNTGSFHNIGTFENNSTATFFNYFLFNNTGTLNNMGTFHNCIGGTFLNNGNVIGTPINQNVDCQALVNTVCSPPGSGNWLIIDSCEISSDIITPASVLVQNNAVVTINSGGSLTIPTGENIIIVNGGGLNLTQGSTLQVNS